MNMNEASKCIHFAVDFRLRTSLLLRSGDEGDFSDSVIERTADGRVHVNGYVWASLLRRALDRLEDTENLVQRIGRYPRDENNKIVSLGVSPLWCGTTLGDAAGSDVRPGNRIDRKWGAAVGTALYSEEVENPGGCLTLEGNFFCAGPDDPQAILEQLHGALWVVNAGIENIGGGWSYGCGRLAVERVRGEILDLSDGVQRKRLWDFGSLPNIAPVNFSPIPIRDGKGWTTFRVLGALEPGQILAIHSAQPDYEGYSKSDHLPDAFVFRAMSLLNNSSVARTPVITGKAFRQAVLSTAIERRLQTEDHDICAMPGQRCTCGKCTDYGKASKTKDRSPNCDCARCRWFGATDQGGIIAVLDAPVQDATCEVLHRIQLCEHSFQNIQLFSGEYLTGGTFNMEILVDEGQNRKDTKKCIGLIRDVLGEIGPERKDQDNMESKNKMAPPGWYRLGATTTCTGQFTIKEWSVNHEG